MFNRTKKITVADVFHIPANSSEHISETFGISSERFKEICGTIANVAALWVTSPYERRTDALLLFKAIRAVGVCTPGELVVIAQKTSEFYESFKATQKEAEPALFQLCMQGN